MNYTHKSIVACISVHSPSTFTVFLLYTELKLELYVTNLYKIAHKIEVEQKQVTVQQNAIKVSNDLNIKYSYP